MISIDAKRIWILTDLHFGIRSNSMEWLENQKQYFYNFFIPKLQKNKQDGDVLFILGDIFDNRQSISVLILNTVLEIFEQLSSIIDIYIILGNHDIFRKKTNDINSLKVLKYLKNVKIFEQPEIAQIGTKKILLMPWRATKDEEQECLENNIDCNYVFCHSGVQNMYFNKYVKMDEGIDINYLTQFDRVITGHIHYHQNKDNVIMPGSPYQLTRGDMNNQKGIYIFYPEKNEYDFLENTFSPIFIRIHLSKTLNWTLAEFNEKINNNYVDLINRYEEFPFEELLDMLENYKAINVVTVDKDSIYLDEEEADLTDFNVIKLTDIVINNLDYGDNIKLSIRKKINELYTRIISDVKDEE